MLEFQGKKAKVTNFNSRKEFHGEAKELAGTLAIEIAVPSDELAMFSPTLRSCMYHKREGVQGDLADQTHEAPNLRFPSLRMPLKLDNELVGGELEIDYGLGGKRNIRLELEKANSIELTLAEGGTCTVGFKAHFRCTPDQAGKLCDLQQETVELTLTPPKAVADLAGEKQAA